MKFAIILKWVLRILLKLHKKLLGKYSCFCLRFLAFLVYSNLVFLLLLLACVTTNICVPVTLRGGLHLLSITSQPVQQFEMDDPQIGIVFYWNECIPCNDFAIVKAILQKLVLLC